jgi:hypothetical protein
MRCAVRWRRFGPHRLVRAFVLSMRERRFGVLLNLSSGAGLEGGEGLGAYAAAKAAREGMFAFWFLVSGSLLYRFILSCFVFINWCLCYIGLSKFLTKDLAPFNISVLTA